MGELAGIAVGAVVMVNILIAGYAIIIIVLYRSFSDLRGSDMPLPLGYPSIHRQIISYRR